MLLADGNVGIGGDPVRMLERARQLVVPDGRVIVEVDSLPIGVCRDYVRWETEHSVGRWFPWAHVGGDAASTLADAAGLRLVSALDVSGRHIVVMRHR